MRVYFVVCLLAAGCATQPDRLAGPTHFDASQTSAIPATLKRQGRVELVVKSNYEQLRREIQMGEGPVLTKALDAAGVPLADRPTRIMQLQSDIGTNAGPTIMIGALMLYGRNG